jgi:hypothetical protein
MAERGVGVEVGDGTALGVVLGDGVREGVGLAVLVGVGVRVDDRDRNAVIVCVDVEDALQVVMLLVPVPLLEGDGVVLEVGVPLGVPEGVADAEGTASVRTSLAS